MANLMGFKKVSAMPSLSPCKLLYQPLIDEVRKTGGIYTLDCNDKRRALSLSTTIRHTYQKLRYTDVRAGVRGTVVYVMKVES